jgi:hypothetical protein
MTFDRFALVSALTLALAASQAACASDRSKEVKSAEANLTSEQQQAREDQAALDYRQAQEQAAAQQKPMTTEQRAELRSDQLQDRSELNAENKNDVAEADKDVTNAHAAMQKERTTVETDAKARFNKADAKAWEAKTKSGKLPAAKKPRWSADWTTYTAKKSEVQNRLGALSSASNEQWKESKAKLEKSLDDLEAAVQRLNDDL